MSLVAPDDRMGLSLDATSHATPASRTPGDRARRAATVVTVVLLTALAVAAVAFWVTGGRWFVVRTPSMGTAAPVGTLVLTRPTTVAALHVGDVVAFHPTNAGALTYTHRVVAIRDGVVTTRGDINGSDDPWATTDRQLVGRAVSLLPGLGFLARALPLLVVGGLLVGGLTRWWLRPDRRGPARMAGFTALYVVASLIVRPFVALVQLQTTTGVGVASITAVSTGILPVRVSALPGHGTATPVHLGYGEVGTLEFSGAAADDRYALMAHVDLSWAGWALLALLWSLPMLWVVLVGFRRHAHPDFVAGVPDQA